MAAAQLPKLPVPHSELASYVARSPATSVEKLMEPFREYEAELRRLYARDRHNSILDDPHLNVLPLFTKHTSDIKTRARNVVAESPEEKDKYIMALPDDKRRSDGSPAVVESLKEFRHNFNVFCESSLVDLDWDNVVAAGSYAVNCLLPVPEQYKKSKRALRQYYHEMFAPASDIDLFLYGLNEQEAIEKIKQIETSVRDAILSEVTVVRTKNAITICSQYPTRHIQIVLRVYKNVSEILTGFDIDCSGAAYDGKQVYCTPRALASYITQINPIDLSRRSPSYENRLSKYSHRNFEVYWPELNRSRIDPTIFERSFGRTLGLARLLILERLPTTNAREQYLKKRREERGRPDPGYRHQYRLFGNIKDAHEDEVADWVDEDEVSNYHTFTVPYGVKFNAKKIEKLCYTRDLLLNAEWNQPQEREVYLHRHPAFFGRVEDVVQDCCGHCPRPETTEEVEIAEKESEIYVSGNVTFRIDDPGRQQIGSFNPLTEDDWTEMAYVGNTARLCQAIVDEDLEHVEDWLSQEGGDPNKRDYTGRTPLHLAITSSTPEVVKCLVDHGARLIARLADGRTPLHLAAGRGNLEMVKTLLEKSAANEEQEDERQDQRRKGREAESKGKAGSRGQRPKEVDEETDEDDSDSDGEIVDDDESDDGVHSATTGSFVKLERDEENAQSGETLPLDDDESDPDFYHPDVVAWDSHCSALHYAILGGHIEVVKLLSQEFAVADILNPVKFGDGSYSDARAAILTLVLALALPVEKAIEMAETLLSLGATSSQADVNGITAFHRYVQHGIPKLVETLWENDKMGLKTAINHVAVSGNSWNPNATSPLMTAVDKGDPILVLRLLEAGAKPQIDFDSWLRGAKLSFESELGDYEANQKKYKASTEQPLILAIRSAEPATALDLLEHGADPNVITKASCNVIESEWSRQREKGSAALDVVRSCLRSLRKYQGEKAYFHFYYESQSRYAFGRAHTYHEVPEGFRGTDEFLQKFRNDTYQRWVVANDIKAHIDSFEHQVKRFNRQQETLSEIPGAKEKKEAISHIISQLEQVEKALVAKGALTFKQQHPEIREPQSQTGTTQMKASREYSFEFNIQGVKDVTESRKAAYIELFEAAWSGDLQKIKTLTLSSWDADQVEPPLKMAVNDPKGNTPFSLAFLRGHLDVAKAIIEIVQAQWAPNEEKSKRYKMAREGDDDSYEESKDESDSDEPKIYEEIVDDQFTIENIGQVSMQVKSDVLASKFLNRNAPTFVMHNGQMDEPRGSENLMSFALRHNDKDRFKFLLDTGIHFTNFKPGTEEKDESAKFFAFPEAQFRYAVSLGRTDMLSDAIKQAGAGIPLEHLVKKSGVEMKTKPRYYQGLTVYGKKRSDWANAGRKIIVKATGSKVPPLLTAAIEGSLASVEWFLSDTPMRRYLEFGKSKVAQEDPRLKHLIQSPGGFDRAITKWLDLQNDLVIHCAVMGPLGEETNRLIRYLIRVCPSSLETKSDHGYTPLYLACLLGRVQFAKTLIDAGADQSVKDGNYTNIVHATVANGPKVDKLRDLLNLLDPDLRTHLFLQRSHLRHGGDTPLHFWLKNSNNIPYEYNHNYIQHHVEQEESEDNVKMLQLLLEFSGGEDLGILNGSGDTILHSAVIRQLPKHMKAILDNDPRLLYRENSVGRTPGEIAYDRFIGMKVTLPSDVAIGQHAYQGNSSYADKQPSEFVNFSSSGKRIPRKERVWEVAQEYLAKFPGKRRLISLNEANDVARRLGESYSWQRYYSKNTSTNEEDVGNGQEKKEEEKESDFVTAQYASKKALAWQDDATQKN
ncbi:putative Ankyrin repeat-containing domain protein [Seiridium unicorne]|uniref:Ankyrin repeat-containing domain protein n=1 Tax=Seiridium unicorne TaxID=138068 RepID=A0ABR2UUU3_9PEZI